MVAVPGVEHTYVVDEDVPVPALEGLVGAARVDVSPEVVPEAVVLDTADLALTRSGTTLRRTYEGWHLELPSTDGDREDVRAPGDAGAGDAPPAALRSLVQVRVRGRALTPIATVRTRRVVHRVVAEDAGALAELTDDSVTTEVRRERGAGVSVSSWRHWGLRVVGDREALVDDAGRLLTEAGARPSTTVERLARALDTTVTRSPAVTERDPSVEGPAAVVVLAQLRAQVQELERRDPGVRRDTPDAVHKMRVASRRLRSALASFRSLLDRETGDHLRSELKWLAEVLGEARDAEVMRDRLTALAADEGPEDRPASTSATLRAGLDDRHRRAHDHVVETLDSPRYFRLLDALDVLLEAPPWEPVADSPAGELLPARARTEWKRVKARVATVETAASDEERDVALHEVRKAAKRLRYACEALVPAFGSPAADTAAAAEHLQGVLGDYQDSVVSRGLLQELAGREEMSGQDALVLGRLSVLEQAHAERSQAEFEDAWHRLSRGRLRRWMRRS